MTDIGLPPGADMALEFPRGDIEYHIWLTVRHLGKVVCWAYSATELDAQGWVTQSMVQVDARGPSRARAAEIADQSRRLIKALPWTSWDGGIVGTVDCVDGPRWEPDENGAPRYVARYAITHHPHPRERSA